MISDMVANERMQANIDANPLRISSTARVNNLACVPDVLVTLFGKEHQMKQGFTTNRQTGNSSISGSKKKQKQVILISVDSVINPEAEQIRW
ncbi:hypothetical protein T265_04531 [Opisthorchis viverrini]|uniref:Uncharacterized protein n=1 Tax=Opisthorchis viverrini TaxID=6198 RepID=A0A074ZZH0_OPIVI|nr:hypothetical protein T265_04531 [Opisthorchis viverrini]KER28655.1 hypothetical protein T265_04531 [Opisthorchis viverrini]